ncbi:penicillin-binding protein [Virgibacillus subterraneus]|uniref:Penicillin-binding protein n=1 Tax=Virgibacillus subterraneus TaxID=621109 RepID=A0A1H9D999_9BACI|nr:transglycosylase domain-containing protein [Virgibacillus subterraneus]SEQ09907.1 penicillin-binding protein [Virgibacillus subterraneus]
MDYKQLFQKYKEKTKSIWATGKVQKSSRITYDVFWNVVLFFVIIGAVGLIFAGGVGAGYFASLVKDEPVRSYASMEKDIYNYEETSKLYFSGNKYIGDIRSDIHREEVKLKNVSGILKDAVIATEDEYFNDHKGIVPKAIVRALVQEATNAAVKTGGSTLTQQLIKNQILTNEVSFERKAKEILLALRLERFFDKDQILEAYLNIVPYGRDASGGNIAGIQTAAQGIFGINASEVNLPQAAYLAGLPQSPSRYTPFKNSGGLKSEEGIQAGLNRMKSVLSRMYESDSISKKQYEKAINYDIVADFSEDSQSPIEKYPYLTFDAEKRAKEKILKYIAKEDGYSMEDLNNDEKLMEEYKILADRALRKNGYKIHTTIDKKTHDIFKKVIKKYETYGPDWKGNIVINEETGETETITQPIETGGILIENSTGRIISFVGGREYTQKDQLNYATDVIRSNGSTMKPILTYAPAIEKGVIQPGTPVADVKTTYSTPVGPYTPGNYAGGYHGLVSARTALENSYNIPAIGIYDQIRSQDPVSEFLKPMGITTLGENEYSNLSLGIGGTTNGVSIEENTNAYSTFGNNGKFADSYMIEKITTADGEVIYEHKSESVDIYSPQTNYLTLDMMRDVISSGTAAYLNSQLKYNGVDWAGKTGTSQDKKDTWFVATNPNVTFGTWMGYEIGKSLECPSCSLGYSSRNVKLWAKLINAASDVNPELVAPKKNFERPGGIVSRSYCAISGMLPSDLCEKAGLVKSDLFNAKYVPTKEDDSLVKGTYVMVDGKAVIAGKNTPKEFTEGDGITFNPEFLKRKGYDKLDDITQLYPRTNREKWEKISLPESEVDDGTIEDDGKKPSAPTSVAGSGNKLNWKKSSSKDVVGYRIYRAKSPEDSFSLVGNTTETSFGISNGKAVYHVKAVDYFGLESSASKEIVVGDFSEPEEPEEPEDDKPDDKKIEKVKNTNTKYNKENKSVTVTWDYDGANTTFVVKLDGKSHSTNQNKNSVTFENITPKTKKYEGTITPKGHNDKTVKFAFDAKPNNTEE